MDSITLDEHVEIVHFKPNLPLIVIDAIVGVIIKHSLVNLIEGLPSMTHYFRSVLIN